MLHGFAWITFTREHIRAASRIFEQLSLVG
jgi:hypothetical protein